MSEENTPVVETTEATETKETVSPDAGLIAESKKEKTQLDEEKKTQQALVASLKKEEGKFAGQIRDKQREADRLEKEIDALIKAAIAAANKESGNTASKGTSESFSLTPEAKALATDFKNNKG